MAKDFDDWLQEVFRPQPEHLPQRPIPFRPTPLWFWVWMIVVAVYMTARPVRADIAYDLNCAINISAEMAAKHIPRDVGMHLKAFYLGRLTMRDEEENWSEVILAHLADQRTKALSQERFQSCMDFYISKLAKPLP